MPTEMSIKQSQTSVEPNPPSSSILDTTGKTLKEKWSNSCKQPPDEANLLAHGYIN